MYIVQNYTVAVLLCIVTMLCWGSWGNTQKLAAKTWRYELFYWDYVIGIVILSLLIGLTLGSSGDLGRSFLSDITQVSSKNFWSAFVGGIIFNGSNILLAASISLAGMSVAFPVGVGLALVLGVFINYFGAPNGDPVILFAGVALVVIAIIAGILLSFFYRFVASAMDLNNFESQVIGMLTPYGAFFIFAIGIFVSNFIFN